MRRWTRWRTSSRPMAMESSIGSSSVPTILGVVLDLLYRGMST